MFYRIKTRVPIEKRSETLHYRRIRKKNNSEIAPNLSAVLMKSNKKFLILMFLKSTKTAPCLFEDTTHFLLSRLSNSSIFIFRYTHRNSITEVCQLFKPRNHLHTGSPRYTPVCYSNYSTIHGLW